MKKFLIALMMLVGCNGLPPVPPRAASPVAVVKKVEKEEKIILWRDFNPLSFIEAKMKHRIVVMVFTSPDCKPCSVMKETTFKNAKVIELLNNDFVPVLIEGDKHLDLLDTFGMERKWPSTVLLSSDGEMMAGFHGYIAPEILEALLEKIVALQKDKSTTTDDLTIHQDL